MRGTFKPEYFFRPSQILRRLSLLESVVSKESGRVQYRLPWGGKVWIAEGEMHASLMERLGVVDLAVTEVLLRLVEPGGHAIDVGANVGCMAAVMGFKLGAQGRLICFEPNPSVRSLLEMNAGGWESLYGVDIDMSSAALSDTIGSATFSVPVGSKSGLGHLGGDEDAAGYRSITVQKSTLDECLARDWAGVDHVSMMKIDVEGHEAKVLRGASSALKSRMIRRVLFEDHKGYPTPVSEILEGYGYHLFRIDKCFLGPRLSDPSLPDPLDQQRRWEPRNFLATLDPVRDRSAIRARGWRSLKRQKRR